LEHKTDEMSSKISTLLAEIKSYSRAEKLFILFVMLCSVCITSQHAIVKPISYSVFVKDFSAAFFPYAWLAMLPINFLLVMLYNKLVSKWGCLTTALGSCCAIITVDAVCALYLGSSSTLNFFYFIWKDINVLLMFQQLWSVVHSTISSQKANYLYGIIYGVGGLGAVFGSCIPGFFATKLGSEKLLFVPCVVYLLFMVFYQQMLKARNFFATDLSIKTKTSESRGGLKLIKSSRILQFILIIVVLMQLASTLIDFSFNTYLANFITDKDMRTEYAGRVFGLIHTVNIFLQFFGAFLFIQVLGMKRSHLLVPSLFACNVLGFLLVPAFSLITLCFSLIKAFDYSIFTIIKEMLYVPLRVEEKFKAKAIIDVFAYRSAKALASLAILALQWLHLQTAVAWILLGVFFVWIIAVAYMLKKELLHTV